MAAKGSENSADGFEPFIRRDGSGHDQLNRKHRRRRRWSIAGTILVVAVLLGYLGGSYAFSSLLLDPHHNPAKDNVEVVASTSNSVTLKRSTASATGGTFGIEWNGGHAIIGVITTSDAATVTRALSDVTGVLTPSDKVSIDPDVWQGDPLSARNVAFDNVTVPTPLGEMPAWFIPGTNDTWVLFVHGIDGRREAGLRVAPVLQQSGLPSLLITYRNDVGAPPSSDGLIHLGMTEWQDLDAAADYAVSKGAQRFVLYGESMGGSIVTRFMHESKHASQVVGMVLDAPVLNWFGVISGQASQLHLEPLAPAVRAWISHRTGLSFDALNEIDQAAIFTVPILLFQGLDDPLVPPSESQAFAEAVPSGNVSYVPVAGARHIQSWNIDPARYESTLTNFLAQWR